MVFQHAINSLSNAIQRHAWVGELAGILPLSALIDFIEIPPKLHILELAGAVPLWSWGITPSGSRLLLSKREVLTDRGCYLDRFGNTVALEALDGRYGERYFVSNPETLRLVLEGHPVIDIKNDHKNMAGEDFDMRVQNLDIVHVSRRNSKVRTTTSRSRWRRVLVDPWRTNSPLYMATSLLGWIILIGVLMATGFLEAWIAFAFVLLNPVTGTVVTYLYGRQPRRLLVENKSQYSRLLVVTEHMNATDWVVLYGESTLVNSLANRPLKPIGSSTSPATAAFCVQLLRLCIVGQWALALASAAAKEWDAYFICFWIAFSIFTHAYIIPPDLGAKDWSKFQANLNIERYGTQLSTRRALINTIVALNPDTFPFDAAKGASDMTKFYSEGMKWLDPILSRSANRALWEKATQKATVDAHDQLETEELSSLNFQEPNGNFPSLAWNAEYKDPRKYYWRRFISEGLYVAAKIKKEANLPGRKVI